MPVDPSTRGDTQDRSCGTPLRLLPLVCPWTSLPTPVCRPPPNYAPLTSPGEPLIAPRRSSGFTSRVHESYTVTKDLTIMGWLIIGGLCGLSDRRADLRGGMIQTLNELAHLTEPVADAAWSRVDS